jgi:hypothetical protein
MEKKLGKIGYIKFGLGGYQDAQLGLSFTLEGKDGWGVCDFRGFWDPHIIECTTHCKWTEENRSSNFVLIMRYISDLLYDAKVDDITKLKGVPIEAIFEGNTLKEWRILTEVL